MAQDHTTPAATTMKRRLRLQRPLEPRSRDALLPVAGLLTLDSDGSGTRLTVSYDVAQIDFRTLLERLLEAGVVPKEGRWQRFRFGLYQFMDENARSNLTARAACCSKPPPGYRPRR